MISRTLLLSCAAAIVLGASTARAQTFPGDDRYAPLPCGAGVMIDAHRDQAGALGERDIVGDVLTPAGFRASDDQFVYFRMRLDQDPAPAKNPRPFAWAFEIDIDGNRSSYELLVVLDGSSKTIAVHRNATTTLQNDPNDPPDTPPVATFPFATHGRSVSAAGSSYGADADFFLDLAVPWATLEPLGLTRTKPVVVWAVTATNGASLNGDLACHDGAGGAPNLSSAAPQPTALDPVVDTDRDGWSDATEISAGTDPNNASSHPSGTPPPLAGAPPPVLQGAGGCTSARAAAPSIGLGAWLAVAIAARVRRRVTAR